MPNAQIMNPAGAYGYATSAQEGQSEANAEMVCQTAITAKQVVALSTTEAQIVPAATNQNNNSIVGVALYAGSAGNPILVATHGPVYSVQKDTGTNIAQFDRLTISATNTATLTNVSNATAVTQIKDVGMIVGVAMAAATTGATTVDVFLTRW